MYFRSYKNQSNKTIQKCPTGCKREQQSISKANASTLIVTGCPKIKSVAWKEEKEIFLGHPVAADQVASKL